MNVALIGAGLQGRRWARALASSPSASLAVVADADPGRADSLAREAGCVATARWEEAVAMPGVKAALVCTPPNLHAPITIAAMGQGRHVLCEKPLARTAQEARQMVDVARTAGVKLKCGFNLRFHPGVQQVQRWLRQGQVGEPHTLRIRYGTGGRPGFDKEWRAVKEVSGGGELMDQGIHAIDLARWLLGGFTRVSAALQTAFWDIAPLEDNAHALLQGPGGRVASIHVSWTQWKNLFSLELLGRDGYLAVEGLGGSYGPERATLGRRDFSRPFTEETVEFRGEDASLSLEWEDFAAAVSDGREPLGTGEDGLEALRVVEAAYESHRTGRVVGL